MTLSRPRLIVVLISLLILVPVSSMLALYEPGVTRYPNPTTYIPGNSTFVAELNMNAYRIVIYYNHVTAGLVFSGSLYAFTNNVIRSNVNSSQNVTINDYGNYLGNTIYSISGMNFSSIYGNRQLFEIAKIFSLNNHNIFPYNDTGYFCTPESNIVLVGGLQSILQSIAVNNNGLNLNAERCVHFDDSAILSFYFFPQPGGFMNHVSGNLTAASLNLYLDFTSPVQAFRFFILFIYANVPGITVIWAGLHSFTLSISDRDLSYLPVYPFVSPIAGKFHIKEFE